MRRIAGIGMLSNLIPDETTILVFWHLLEKHSLGEQIFEKFNAHLRGRGMGMKQGTIIYATFIAATSSTMTKNGKRDPEMHQTKNGNQWYFWMTIQTDGDKCSGLIHSVVTTAINDHGLTPAAELLHGDEEEVHAVKGYQDIVKRQEMACKVAQFGVVKRPVKRHAQRDTPGHHYAPADMINIKSAVAKLNRYKLLALGAELFQPFTSNYTYLHVRFVDAQSAMEDCTLPLPFSDHDFQPYLAHLGPEVG